jgi:hypothetical protein
MTDGRVENIGPPGARLRAVVGLATLAAAFAASVALVATGVPRPWRLAVFPLFAFALSGLEQARTRV